MTEEFQAFPKIARLSREIVVTEKIDGTNACVKIYAEHDETGWIVQAGSRSRWITPQDDNFGFAKWVEAHREELITGLGEGTHYGEWWGSGIQRGYGLTKGEKKFSLFNVHRWADTRPACCDVVPTLHRGVMCTEFIEHTLLQLKESGSRAAPGFMNPEGIIIYHTAAQMMFKKTLDKDDEYKSKAS